MREAVDARAYEKALLSELDWFAAKTPGRRLASIFFGGGTPSLMPPATAAAVIEAACGAWRPAPDPEITLEANPGSAEAAKFEAFACAGVNRLSLGVQSLRPDALKFLGRIHGVDEALAAIRLARDTFPRFSFDMIYARPGQTMSAWEEELGEALALARGHLSLYQLTLEKDTAFYRKARRGELTLPEGDAAADLFELTQKLCRRAGLAAYEVSNFARPGEESRHNLAYWRGLEYAGIGPGAHSRIRVNGSWQAIAAIKSPEGWLAAAGQNGNGFEEVRALAPGERAEEAIMTGLRLYSGINRGEFARAFGTDPMGFLEADRWMLLAEEGLVFETPENLGVTRNGMLVLDSILGEVLA